MVVLAAEKDGSISNYIRRLVSQDIRSRKEELGLVSQKEPVGDLRAVRDSQERYDDYRQG